MKARISTPGAWDLREHVLGDRHDLSPLALIAVTVAAAAGWCAFAFLGYTFAFGLYGLLLSFFAEMEPHELFGRNGFINSDFWTPVHVTT